MVSVAELEQDEDIENWLEKLEDAILAKNGEVPDARKLATLRNSIGPRSLPIIKQLQKNLPEADRNVYAQVKIAVINHFRPRSNIIVQRNTFNNMYQDEGEKIDHFVQRLRIQSSKCEFKVPSQPAVEAGPEGVPPAVQEILYKDITDDLIRDRVVVGLNNNDVRERLFREGNLTLESALNIIQAIETAALQQRKLTESGTSIHSLKKWKMKKQYNRNPQDDSSGSDNKLKKCSKCGKTHRKFNCPAFKRKCNKCHSVGHFQVMCRKNSKSRVDEMFVEEDTSSRSDSSETSSELSDSGFLSHHSSVRCDLLTITPNLGYNSEINVIANDWIEQIEFKSDKLINCKIDTGAQSNVISIDVLNRIDSSIAPIESNIRLTAFGGNKIETLGSAKLNLQFNDIFLPDVPFIVVRIYCQTIIGLHYACKLKLVSIPNSVRLGAITNHSTLYENVVCSSSRPQHNKRERTCNSRRSLDPGNCKVVSRVSKDTDKGSSKVDTGAQIIAKNKAQSSKVSKDVTKSCKVVKTAKPECSKASTVKGNKDVTKSCKVVKTAKPECSKASTVKVNKDVTKSCKVVNEKTSKDVVSGGSKVTKVKGTKVKDANEGSKVIQQKISEVKKTGKNCVNNSIQGLIDRYNDVFEENKVGLVQGEEYDIKLKSDYRPVIHAARRIPFSTADKIDLELKRMQELKVIEPVNGPTEWVNSMTVTQKPGGKIRICLDPTDLNKNVLREHMQAPTIEELHTRLSGAKYFSKLDLKDGYWQIPLSYESSFYTTFNTPKGRYRYTRLPFGLNSSNEIFHKRVSNVYEGLLGVLVLYDDVLVFANTKEEHDMRLAKCLERTRNQGIKLNLPKCKFQQKEVVYVGHLISSEGIKPNPARIQDILDMPNPTDVKGCQRILGMLNYLSRYIPNMSELTYPIRLLLIKGTHFQWSFEQEEAMKNIKKVLTSYPVLKIFDVKKPVTLNVDASQNGAGACILQENGPVAYASRSLTPTQRSYSQIEKELTAIVFGAERFYQYLFGKKVTVETDHKPLVTILKRPLYKAPARCQRLLLRLQRFDMVPKYVPGKNMHISDTLSRAFSTKSRDKCEKLESETEFMIHALIQDIALSSRMMSKIQSETKNDLTLSTVKSLIIDGWPKYIKNCHETAKPYFNLRNEMTIYQNIILYNDRVVIPKALQSELLQRLHVGHQGQERCKNLARKSIYWRGINSAIDTMVRDCEACLLQRALPARGKLIPHKIPNRVWEKIGADLFYFEGITYQIVVCFLSKWSEVKKFPIKHPSAKQLIEHFKDLFSTYGIPNELFSDNAIYNSREFKDFGKEFDIKLTYSSPHYAQSNGQSENAVKTVKNILRKCARDGSDFRQGLLQFRNTPLSNSLESPAFLFFNRYLRSNLPMANTLLTNDHCEKTRSKLADRQNTYAEYYNRTKSETVNKYVKGQNVVYRNGYDDKKWRPGVIVEKHPDSNRSYNILNTKGNVVRRNVRFILPDHTTREFTIIPTVLPQKIQVPPTPDNNPKLPDPPHPEMQTAAKAATTVTIPVKNKAETVQGSQRLTNVPEPRRSARLKEKASKVQN